MTDDIPFFADLVESLFQETVARRADGELGLLLLVHDEVYLRVEFLAEEMDQ